MDTYCGYHSIQLFKVNFRFWFAQFRCQMEQAVVSVNQDVEEGICTQMGRRKKNRQHISLWHIPFSERSRHRVYSACADIDAYTRIQISVYAY